MIFSAFAAICVIVCWKTGIWRNWKEYYPTILYFFIGSLTYGFLFSQKPLWAFNIFFYHYPFMEISLTAILYSGTVILFLSYFPNNRRMQIPYLLLCAAIYTVTEGFSFLIGDFIYFNGWNLFYSALFNLAMFPLLWLHSKKPLLIWPISTILAFAVIWLFQIPLFRQ
jgi:hypothetical protein